MPYRPPSEQDSSTSTKNRSFTERPILLVLRYVFINERHQITWLAVEVLAQLVDDFATYVGPWLVSHFGKSRSVNTCDLRNFHQRDDATLVERFV